MHSPASLPARRLPVDVDLAVVFTALATEAATDATGLFWLDAGADAGSGWSYLGCGVVTADASAVRAQCLDGTGPTEPGLPPFRGGWIGWAGYEEGAAVAGAQVAVDETVPGQTWIGVTHLLAIDHANGVRWVLAQEHELDEWIAWLVSVDEGRPSAAPVSSARVARARHGVDDYTALVERCREAIRVGDAYQLCLTTRFTVEDAPDPVQAYLRLRAASPAHHGGFIRVGAHALLSASPEQFLHVSGGVARTRPIKGTRPRGATAEADARLARELVESEKERAENVMIVDLMRNDLSRVSEPGTIAVEALWAVESYPAVHQLVSTVSGHLTPGVRVGDLMDAVFPAGSMTGAPKLSAMTILHALETAPRGIYSGCFGFIGLDGEVDLAMVIRTIIYAAGTASVGAGGGITWLSNAAEEAAEAATKARAPLAALGAALPEEWSDLLQKQAADGAR